MVSGLIDEYPDTFAAIYFHVSGDGYDKPWGNDRGALFYDIWSDGVPWLAYDGLWDAWPIDTYESKLNLRQAITTDVTIEMGGVEADPVSHTFDVTARVCVEPDGVGRALRVYMIQALDHFPAEPSYERNCFLQAATTEDVTIAAGECAEVVRAFTFDSVSWARPSDIRIVAWAQAPLDVAPAEVAQARVMRWPFSALGSVFVDGFESGDTSGWSTTAPAP